MPTFDEVLYWSGTDLESAGSALKITSKVYETVYLDLNDLEAGDLEGAAAEAEAKAWRVLADDAMDLWNKMDHSGNDLIEASTTVTNLSSTAWDIKARVEASGLMISSGVVTPPSSHLGDYPNETIASYQDEITFLMGQVTDTISFLQSVYDDIATLDETASGPGLEIINAGVKEPNPAWTADEVNDWWTSLSDAERADIITKHPAWIGNLDGIPMNDRNAANQVWLPIMQRDMEQQIAEYEPKYRELWIPVGNGAGRYIIQPTEEYARLLDKKRDIDALAAMIAAEKDNPPESGKHTLLVLDNTGDHFRAAVGTGDVDSADHVLVYTPGMSNSVFGDVAAADGKPGSKVEEVERITAETHLHLATADNEGEETVAGVVWLGYDSPSEMETMTFSEGTVLNDNEAEKSGPDLAGFYDGIQATHRGDPHLVAGGHSYGSVVTGYALRDSTAPDDVVIWGSPGPTSVDASELGTLPDHMYSASANWDVVAASGIYGGNPTTDPNSDFTSLDTGKQDGLKASSGHSEYTDTGTTSLHNIGQIVAGEDPDYVDP